MRLFVRYYLWIIAALLFAGCSNGKVDYIPKGEKVAGVKEGRLVLGVMPSLPPTKLFTKYQPLADYLTRKTGKEVVVSTAPDFQEYIVRLKKGEYELILPNAYQYIMVSKEPGYIPLVKVKGIPYKGLIVVRKDSGINSVSDLKGKRIAYADPSALYATMQVKVYLKEHGVDSENDMKESYAASQDSVILGVYQKLFDAAGTWPEAFDAISGDTRNQLKVLAETETLPSRPIAVRADIPQEIAEKVKGALINMTSDPEGQKILASLRCEFEGASDRDFDKVRDWARKNGYPF